MGVLVKIHVLSFMCLNHHLSLEHQSKQEREKQVRHEQETHHPDQNVRPPHHIDLDARRAQHLPNDGKSEKDGRVGIGQVHEGRVGEHTVGAAGDVAVEDEVEGVADLVDGEAARLGPALNEVGGGGLAEEGGVREPGAEGVGLDSCNEERIFVETRTT